MNEWRAVRRSLRRNRTRRERVVTLIWLAVGAAGFALSPWVMPQDSVLWPVWLWHFTSRENAPALVQAAMHGRWWLWPPGLLLLLGSLL